MRRLTAGIALFASLAVTPAWGQCPNGAQEPCPTPPRASVAPNSVAVLYFDNITRDTSDAYLADGLTESIIVRLGAIQRLQVKSRGAVRPLRGQPAQDPTELGNRLRAAYLVTGSVRRSARNLRVTVELLRASNGVQVWAQQYDRADDDALTVEQEIASAVVGSIAGRLLPAESAVLGARPTRVPAAFNHFLRGHYYLAQRSADGMARAVSAYEAAARDDPSFTAAIARAAYAYSLAVAWEFPIQGLTIDSLLQRGLATADRALRADSTVADAWLALGVLRAYERPDEWRLALAAFDRTVALDARMPEAHHIRGWYLFVLGRDAEALAAWRRTLAIEPERPVTYWYLARVALVQRRFRDCLVLADSAIGIDRGFGAAYVTRATCQSMSGDNARARSDAAEAVRLAGPGESEGSASVAAAFVDMRSGDTAAVRRRLIARTTGTVAAGSVWQAYAIGALHAFLGERERAVASLDGLRVRPGSWIIQLREPQWDSMRDYAPFARLVSDMTIGRP